MFIDKIVQVDVDMHSVCLKIEYMTGPSETCTCTIYNVILDYRYKNYSHWFSGVYNLPKGYIRKRNTLAQSKEKTTRNGNFKRELKIKTPFFEMSRELVFFLGNIIFRISVSQNNILATSKIRFFSSETYKYKYNI